MRRNSQRIVTEARKEKGDRKEVWEENGENGSKRRGR